MFRVPFVLKSFDERDDTEDFIRDDISFKGCLELTYY